MTNESVSVEMLGVAGSTLIKALMALQALEKGFYTNEPDGSTLVPPQVKLQCYMYFQLGQTLCYFITLGVKIILNLEIELQVLKYMRLRKAKWLDIL